MKKAGPGKLLDRSVFETTKEPRRKAIGLKKWWSVKRKMKMLQRYQRVEEARKRAEQQALKTAEEIVGQKRTRRNRRRNLRRKVARA